MNVKYDFTRTGGFPLDQGVLNDLQKGILEAEGALAALLGPLAIISGCAVTGGSAANGIVAVNGEILPFVGGVLGAKVIVVEADTNLTYFDASTPPSNITRYATFGDDGVQNNPWVNFIRNDGTCILPQQYDVKQIDCPSAYITANFDSTGLGINLRTGWAICNGNNGTQVRLGRVAVQLDASQTEFATIGQTGGEKTHVLTIPEMPAHTHGFIDPTGGLDFGSGSTRTSNTNAGAGTTGSTGGGGAHNNLQPYLVTLFIQKL